VSTKVWVDELVACGILERPKQLTQALTVRKPKRHVLLSISQSVRDLDSVTFINFLFAS
jgi:hypothetical protein